MRMIIGGGLLEFVRQYIFVWNPAGTLSSFIGVLSKRTLRLGSFRPLCLWNKYGWMNLNIFLSPPNFHPCVDGKLLLYHKKFISTRRYIHSSWSNNVSRLGRRHRLFRGQNIFYHIGNCKRLQHCSRSITIYGSHGWLWLLVILVHASVTFINTTFCFWYNGAVISPDVKSTMFYTKSRI